MWQREDPQAVAVIRAWIEGEPPGVLKVSLTRVAHDGRPEVRLGATPDIHAVGAMVEAWLESFVEEHLER